MLIKIFCKVEAQVDDKGNVLIDQNNDPEVKVPNPKVELFYTYMMAWYVIHCPSLMTVVHAQKTLCHSCKS